MSIGAGTVPENNGQVLKNGDNVLRGGNRGNGLIFPGVNEYVAVDSASLIDSFDTTQDFSVSLLISFDDPSLFNLIFSADSSTENPDETTTASGFASFTFESKIVFEFRDDPDRNFSGSKIIQSDIVYLLVFTFSSTTNECKIFIDDQLDVSSTLVPTNATSSDDVFGPIIGSYSALNLFQKGPIYSTAMYNKTLSLTEVQSLFRLENNPYTAGLGSSIVAYWPFDERQGGTVKDRSGNGYDGTLVNYTSAEKSLGSDNKHVNGYTQNSIER